MTMGLLQDTYLHVCAICNVCVHLVVVVVVVIVIPATHTSFFSKHEKVAALLIFIGPRCPWGPIYGSGCLKQTRV